MLHPSTKRLIDKLIEMTASSKIDWKEGDENSCIYDTEGYRVMIAQGPSRMVLLDAAGRVLETVSDAMLANTRDADGEAYSVKIDMLVSNARRAMTGAADVIDKLVSFLDGDGMPDDNEMVDAPVAETVTDYPDHPEMKSRVAMLAESLKDHSITASDTPDEAEVVEETEEEEFGAWTLPETAEASEAAPVEDLEVESAPTEEGYTPLEVTPLIASEDEAEGALDGLPAVDRVRDVEPQGATEPEPVLAVEGPAPEAFVHEAPIWEGSWTAINAVYVTPSIYTEPTYVAAEPAAEEPVYSNGHLETVDDFAPAMSEVDAPVEAEVAPIVEISFEEMSEEADRMTTIEDMVFVEVRPESYQTTPDAETYDAFREASDVAMELTTETASEPVQEPAPVVEKEPEAPTRRTVYKYNPWM